MSIKASLKRLSPLASSLALREKMLAEMRRTNDQLARLQELLAHTVHTNQLLTRAMYEQAFATARFQEPKRLLRHGFKVYSQNDEDGIIEEIFERIGTTGRFFVEFGAGDGLENCTAYCLLKNWSGVWMEANSEYFAKIERNLGFLIREGRLRVKNAAITAENIEALFLELGVPAEFDFLAIDIDRNDYWVWKALQHYRPRVVAIEYNASLKQTASVVVPYAPEAAWDETNYYGASLKALERLGEDKGYRLVGCNYVGVNAFFVREDLVGDRFAAPFTSENHYEPPRYPFCMENGHRPNLGPWEQV
jgi:hypothetical protein